MQEIARLNWTLSMSPRWMLTAPVQQELWTRLATEWYTLLIPARVWQLLDSLRRQRPDNLHPVIRWAIENTVGFAPIALGSSSEGWEIEPEVPDSEYDAGTLAEIEAQVEEKRQASAATMGRVRRGSSGFLGVHLQAKTGRWRARIRVGGKRLHLGYYDTAELAAVAYDQAALEHFGERAVVNDQALKIAWLAGEQEKGGV